MSTTYDDLPRCPICGSVLTIEQADDPDYVKLECDLCGWADIGEAL